MNNKLIAIGVASFLSLGAGVAYAQDHTVPDTSVRNLEVPQDVRNKQLRAETPPSTTILQGRSDAAPPVKGDGMMNNK